MVVQGNFGGQPANQGDGEQAVSLIKPLYDAFEEGHTTPDLIQAKELLSSLES